MTNNIQTALDEKIRKLTQLRDLLSDPEIAKIARNILSQPRTAKPAIDADISIVLPASQSTPRARRTLKKKRGTLVKKVAEIVTQSTSALTARDVADALESQGFNIQAQDKAIAVSKALRTLATKQKIIAKKGDHAKAAISYMRLPSLVPLIPVQEMRH
jgi:hypothetical protein